MLGPLLALLGRVVCLCAGFIYPAWASYAGTGAEKTDERARWLKYWVTLAVMLQLFPLLGLVEPWLLPKNTLQAALHVWLVHPQTLGAWRLYNSTIGPLLERHEEHIDRAAIGAHAWLQP